MVHHIPDIKSDQMATPIKSTSVVWFVEKFGIQFSRFPPLLYYVLAFFCSILLLLDRFWTGLIVLSLLLIAMYCVYKIQPKNVQQVTNIEKTLLLLAVVIAITLGIGGGGGGGGGGDKYTLLLGFNILAGAHLTNICF